MVEVEKRLELLIWREACRHLDIDESLTRMVPLLAERLPISSVLLRRLDPGRARLETVAAGGPDVAALPTTARTDLSPAQLARLLALVTAGRVRRGAAANDETIADAVPAGIDGEVIVGPLADETGPAGVFVLVACSHFTVADAALAQSLLEPFTVALANDARVHELARLREAVEADNRALLTRLGRQSIVDSIVGEKTGLAHVIERVEQVAKTDVPVLILGETGSGKEVVARAIHERSRRAQGPIVRVNCGAIPTELVDSELFGHERGAFTGAAFARKGWFERADGGTLFLDEIAELPLAAQVRLLRVLQDGTLERVGGQRTLHVDVRIVAATHRDLHAMVAEGRFREDLWYRVGVFPLRLPPLRERLQDLLALASHFAARAGQRLGAGPLTPSPSDLALLLGYPWPGNVRELQAVIDRAAILGHGRKLEIAAALGAGAPRVTSPSPAALSPKKNGESEGQIDRLDLAMAAHIERALAATRGRVEGEKGAAALLGINPHTLRARMRKLGVDWTRHR